jgi:hypothetical protein
MISADSRALSPPSLAPLGEALVAAGVAAGVSALLVWAAPPGMDLAAHVYQRTIYLRHGLTFWDNFWYAGRYSFVTYSLLYYPLAGLLGIKALAVSTVAAAALAFSMVAGRQWGSAAAWSSRAFAVMWAGVVLSAAFPFALGAALALLAIWSAQARRLRRLAVLSLLALAASPLAFLLLLIVLVAIAVPRPRERRFLVGAGLVLGTLGLVELALWRLFPSSGRYPFSSGELAAALVFCAGGAALTWRNARAGDSLAFSSLCRGLRRLLRDPLGAGREHRPAALRRRTACAARALPAQLAAARALGSRPRPGRALEPDPARDEPRSRAVGPGFEGVVLDAGGPVPEEPSLSRLSRGSGGHGRPLGRGLPAPAGIPLARGWFRQDDFPQNAVLYGRLGPRAYAGWLRALGIGYVVTTSAPPDYSARAEERLIESGRLPLRLVLSTRNVRIYAVRSPRPLITGPGRPASSRCATPA